jgi:glycosyltransferase involved in cell wall biosynthesis
MEPVYIIANNAIRKYSKGYTVENSGVQLFNDLVDLEEHPIFVSIMLDLDEENVNEPLSPKVRLFPLSIFTSHKGKFKKTVNYLYAILKLIYVILKGKIFYIYVPSNLSFLSLFLLKYLKKNYGLYVRGMIHQSRFSGKVVDNKFLYRAYVDGVKNAEFLIVTGTFLFNELSPLNENCERVVPMFNVNKADVVENKNFNEVKNLIYVGRLDYDKGVEDLINAISILHKKEEPFFLRIVGTGEKHYVSKLEKFIDEQGIRNCVKLYGRIDKKDVLVALYKSSDIFVFPSHHEGFPRVVYEAMTFGLPIVATDIDAYKGTLTSGVNSELVDIKSPKALADAISALINSTPTLHDYSEKGVRFMIDSFNRYEKQSHATQLKANVEKIRAQYS